MTYALELGEAKGPFTVETELLYQPMNYRWVENLRKVHGTTPNDEAERFLRLHAETPNRPAVIAQDTSEEGGTLKNPAKPFVLEVATK
ncbi:MAG: hypothetical protein R3D02_07565 [Hyphomicrobiales bacterium]